jgi:hypothetical protein
MAIDTASNNVFRYIHFRPARLTDAIEEEVRGRADGRNSNETQDTSEDDRPSIEGLHRSDLREALRNLQSVDLSREADLVQPEGRLEAPLAVLNSSGLARLTDTTRTVLSRLGVDPSTTDHRRLMDTVGAKMADMEREGPSYVQGDNQPALGFIRSVGTAQLEVLKQQIKRYEPGEIAHIENVSAGEKKIRRHNDLTRIEEFSSVSSERTTDTETELETTERFELNKESSRTFQKDTELGLELTVAGKYGPTVSFEANFSTGQSTSTTTETQQSVGFAKDTVERSKEWIIESIAVRQERTLVREITETNTHTLANESSEHRFAIYQYVDKIYQSQVFDYGKRLMFDFMVPEPASFLWYLKSKTNLELDIPVPKSLADRDILSPSDITPQNYWELGAAYGVSDLPMLPDLVVTKRLRLAHGDGSTSDDGPHKSGVSGELDIPEGYRPRWVRSSLLATSDETFSFSVDIGGKVFHYPMSDFVKRELFDGHDRYSLVETSGRSIEQPLAPDYLGDDQKLYVDVYGYESANYTIQMDVQFNALYDSDELDYDVLVDWKQQVYAKLMEAYQNALVQYQQELAFQTAQAEARQGDVVDFGAPPAVNAKLINTELKKHCLAIIRGEHAGTLVTTHSGEPPQFDIAEAREDGEEIRFLEHAFEWNQIQYVFYPYFWARPDPESDLSGWADRMLEHNPDYTMEEFLKAGYARVVVPVREGFDAAISYYVENHIPWEDLGEPEIKDALYVSIIKELKERTGAGKDEIPVGDPWETRLPTAAVIVRLTDSLPEWTLKDGTDWEWVPVNA